MIWVYFKMTVNMKNKNLSENEILKQIVNVQEEISSLESHFDISSGSGFGGGISDERQLNYQIKFKKDEESRLARDLNNLLLKKTKKSSNIAAWLAAIAALASAVTAIHSIHLF